VARAEALGLLGPAASGGHRHTKLQACPVESMNGQLRRIDTFQAPQVDRHSRATVFVRASGKRVNAAVATEIVVNVLMVKLVVSQHLFAG